MHASCQSHVPGVPGTASGLAHTPVFVAQGDADPVIPRELLDDTWTYLLTESGAAVGAHRDPCGHGITPTTLHRLPDWLDARLNYLAVKPVLQTPTRQGPTGRLSPTGCCHDGPGLGPRCRGRSRNSS